MLRPLTQKYLVVIKISCSFPMLGVCSLIWKGEVGGWSNRCSAWRTGERRRRIELRKKKNSWGLVVIFHFLRVLSVKKGCTVLLFSFGHTFVVVFSRQDVRNFLVRPQTKLNSVNIIFSLILFYYLNHLQFKFDLIQKIA